MSEERQKYLGKPRKKNKRLDKRNNFILFEKAIEHYATTLISKMKEGKEIASEWKREYTGSFFVSEIHNKENNTDR